MERALQLAAQGRDTTFPNPCVGAVLTDACGRVLGEGFHTAAGRPHAEVEALNDARARGNSVQGATCYVTLEPCNHWGRTGPCSEALLAAGVARVVIATIDPHKGVHGGAARLRDAGVVVEVGLLGEEARLLNAGFLTYHQLGRPLVTLKWAMTLDGCTSTRTGDSKWITSEEARAEVHRRRARHGAVVAGIETVLQDHARLSARTNPPARFPVRRVVLDRQLRLPLTAPFLEPVENQPAVIYTQAGTSAERASALRAAGADVRVLAAVEPASVLADLAAQGVQSVLIEGGRRVAGSFLAAGLVDRVEAWIAPRVLGGGATFLGPVHRADAPDFMREAGSLERVQVGSWGPDVLIEGWLSRHLLDD